VQVSVGNGGPCGLADRRSCPIDAAIASGGDATVAYLTPGPAMISRDLIGGTWAAEQRLPFAPTIDGYGLALAVSDGGAGTQLALGGGPSAAVRSGRGEPWTAIDAPFPTFPFSPAPAVSPTGDLAIAADLELPPTQPFGVFVALRPFGASEWSAPLLVGASVVGSAVEDVVAAADGHGALDVGWSEITLTSPQVTTMKVAQVSLVDGVATAPQTLASFTTTKPGKRPLDLSLASADGRSVIAWVADKHVDAAERQAGSSRFVYLGSVSGTDSVYSHALAARAPVASVSDDGGALLAWIAVKRKSYALRAMQSSAQDGSFSAAVTVAGPASSPPLGLHGAKLPGSGAMLVWSSTRGSVDASRATGPTTWTPQVVVASASSASSPEALAAARTGEAITIWQQDQQTWASTFAP
jgi:hypothetical protein